jgi:hypothetical protein
MPKYHINVRTESHIASTVPSSATATPSLEWRWRSSQESC